MPKRSEVKVEIEALLKDGDTGTIQRSLENAEQRVADVRASVAADKSSKNGRTPQKEPQPDNEQRKDGAHEKGAGQEPRHEA